MESRTPTTSSVPFHRPLHRVTYGNRVPIGPLSEAPTRLAPLLTFSPSPFPHPAPRTHPPTHLPLRLEASAPSLGASTSSFSKGPLEDLQDSCYSSCSDSDHSSLSRNTSAASETLAQETLYPYHHTPPWEDYVNSQDYRHLLDFSLKLGFSEEQLSFVLNKLGTFPPVQDRVLAELTELGRPDLSHSMSPLHSDAHVDTSSHRAIIIDGSNLAMTHGHKEVFSCLGIKECVDYFKGRGHSDIKVFVPQFRKEQPRPDSPITDQHILLELEREGILVWTPSRRVGGRRIVCHDDRYILKTAVEKEAVVVSNDEYRDLMKENGQFRRVVEERLLMYSFVDGKFMPPDDPLGRHGPKLDQFLRKGGAPPSAPLCPYGRKCTYGNKCKFFHPERPGGIHVSVTERLSGKKSQLLNTPSLNLPSNKEFPGKTPAYRTQSLNAAAISYRDQSLSPQRKVENLQVPASCSHLHPSLSKHFSNPEQKFTPTDFTRPPPPPPPHMSWPWADLMESGHEALTRNVSAPVKEEEEEGTARREAGLGGFVKTLSERKGSLSDSQLHLLSTEEAWRSAEGTSSNMFVPSSAVWGSKEFSVSPVPPPTLPPHPPSPPQDPRSKLHYHLSNIFPQQTVSTVMEMYPQETDPQVLCSLIIQLHSSTSFHHL